MHIKNKLSKIVAIASISSFLAGCGPGGQDANNQNSQDTNNQDPQEIADEYAGMSEADYQYAIQQAKEFKFDQAALGFAAAAEEFVASKYYGLVLAGQSSYRLNIEQQAVTKEMNRFKSTARQQVIDYYQGKKMLGGNIVMIYSPMVAKSLNINDPLLQRIVSTVQLHESGGYELAILCNKNKKKDGRGRDTVDFGMGQVNTVSWESDKLCKGMVNSKLIDKANELCEGNPAGNKTNALIRQALVDMIAGKSISSLSLNDPHNIDNQDAMKAVISKDSPFNPIVNTTCTYKHLQVDLAMARNFYKTCAELRNGSKLRFACSGDKPSQFDYWTVALVNYGGSTKTVIATGERLGKPLDDYINEFRSAYVVLFGDKPPF